MKNVSIKLKFRRSVNPEKEGSLIYQLIYERKVCRITSKYKIFNHEWDEATGQILFSSLDSSRDSQLGMIRFNVDWELHQLCKIVDTLALSGQEWTFSDLTSHFNSFIDKDSSVFHFIQMQIQRKKQLGKVRSSETYQATLNSFMSFRCGVDLTFDMIDFELMELYEAELQNRGLTRNTSSFYLRILRTNYKLAVEKGLTQDCHPFKRVYCGIDKTVKRSLSFAKIKQIKELDLSLTPSLDFARDMFLFSFCTRGMSFVDMAYLKKKDLKNGYLTYRRKKTGQLLTVEWTRQMQDIIDKYPINPTQYLLPKRGNAKQPAYKLLGELKIRFFTPMVWKLRIRQGKRVRQQVPFMPDLLFVYDSRKVLDPLVEQIATLQYRFIKGGNRQPMTVRNADMERFIRAVDAMNNPCFYTPEEINPDMLGKKVRIVGGLLDGYEGCLQKMQGSRIKRLFVELPNLLTATVEVQPEFIQVLKS